jgi:trans-aconitate methyltransferase
VAADDHADDRLSANALWDGAHYSDHTEHHRRHDNVMTSRLSATAPDARILDVGCGVGDFTVGLLPLVPKGTVRGVDADASMIATARSRNDGSGIAFDVCRAQDLATLGDGIVDLLVSTACLHWVPRGDHPAVLAGARTVLTEGGRLLVEFGGHGQLAEVRAVLDPLAVSLGGGPPSWWFAAPDQYVPLLEDAGFAVDECVLLTQTRAMPDVDAMRGWLTSQVLVGYRPHLPSATWEAFVDGAVAGVEQLLRQDDGTCDVTYVRLLVDARAA